MEKKKAAAAAAVATVITASGAAVEANFDDPADILQSTNVEPQVQHIDADLSTDEDAVQDEEDRQKTTGSGIFRDWVLGLPMAVRAIFVVPAWIAGTIIMGLGEVLFTALSPFAHWILSFLLMVLAIGGAFLFAAKAMFPDLPISKIINRHSIKWILVVSVVAFAADLILGVFWTGYTRYKMLVIGGLMLLAVGSLAIWFGRRESRRRKKEAAETPEQIIEEPQELEFTSLGETFKVRPSQKKQ